jgi:hypothetical protein
MGVFSMPFVQPLIERLPLDDGHWIEIKRKLAYGDMQTFASKSRGDLTIASLNLIAAYLQDWSLVDAEGQPVRVDDEPSKIAALRALSPEAFEAIDEAIDKHIKGLAAEKKSKAPSGRPKSKTS